MAGNSIKRRGLEDGIERPARLTRLNRSALSDGFARRSVTIALLASLARSRTCWVPEGLSLRSEEQISLVETSKKIRVLSLSSPSMMASMAPPSLIPFDSRHHCFLLVEFELLAPWTWSNSTSICTPFIESDLIRWISTLVYMRTGVGQLSRRTLRLVRQSEP